MESQGKRKDQVGASEIIAGVCFIGLIITLLALVVYNILN